MSDTICEKGMLVCLTIKGFWSAVIKDEQATNEVAAKYGANPNVGRYMKKLLDPKKIPALKKVNQDRSALRQFHYKLTLPWNDDGTRLLPAAMYFDYTSGITERTNALNGHYDEFLEALPTLREQAKRDLNGLFREDDWPEAKDLKDRLSIRTKIFPLADASDFRCNLGAEHDALIKQEITANIYGKLTGGLCEVYTRLHACVQDMVERLEGYQVDAQGKVVKTFKDSAVNNLRELIDIVPKLNVMDDPTLTQIAESLRMLVRNDAQKLRDDYVVRGQTVGAGKAIAAQLAKVTEILGGGGQ